MVFQRKTNKLTSSSAGLFYKLRETVGVKRRLYIEGDSIQCDTRSAVLDYERETDLAKLEIDNVFVNRIYCKFLFALSIEF